MEIELKGTKIVEVPYFAEQLTDLSDSILIIGEHLGGTEGVSETVKVMGFTNVTTTDIQPEVEGSWLKTNTDWNHIQTDFSEFDDTKKYDIILSISVFEHFGFWFSKTHLANGMTVDDLCRWNHDLVGINKACKLLKNSRSKLIITLPAGPFLNYDPSGQPFLRSYDFRRQKIIHDELQQNGFRIADEKFFYSSDYVNWSEVDSTINDPRNYSAYSSYSPNVIWGLTIKKNS